MIRPHPPRHTDPEVRPRSPPDRSEALNSRQSERRAHHQITRCAERTSKQAERRQRNTCLHAKKEEPVLAGLELRPAAPLDDRAGELHQGVGELLLATFVEVALVTRPSASVEPRMCAIRTSGWSTETTGQSLPLGTDSRTRGASRALPDRELWISSGPAASSSIAGVAGHSGGAEAAERGPRGRPSTARLHREQ